MNLKVNSASLTFSGQKQCLGVYLMLLQCPHARKLIISNMHFFTGSARVVSFVDKAREKQGEGNFEFLAGIFKINGNEKFTTTACLSNC